MATPTALLVSCSASINPDDLMKSITRNEGDAAPFCSVAEGVKGYRWEMSNKYYTASILMCVAEPCIMGSLTLGDSMEGIVIAITDEEESFKTARSQWATVKEMSPEVRILACKQFTKSPGAPKAQVLDWCLDNAFELVELERPEDEEDEEEDDGFGVEPYGVKRIISALHAHTWSNLEMKDESNSHLLRLQERFADSNSQEEGEDTMRGDDPRIGYLPLPSTPDGLSSDEHESQPAREDLENRTEDAERQRIEHEDSDVRTSDNRVDGVEASDRVGDGGSSCQGNGNRAESNDAGRTYGAHSVSNSTEEEGQGQGNNVTPEPDRIDAMLNEDAALFAALGNEDPGEESFDQLFARMASMKEKASSLVGEERRRYAEKVAIAFWRAVGGGEDEINGLDSDSD